MTELSTSVQEGDAISQKTPEADPAHVKDVETVSKEGESAESEAVVTKETQPLSFDGGEGELTEKETLPEDGAKEGRLADEIIDENKKSTEDENAGEVVSELNGGIKEEAGNESTESEETDKPNVEVTADGEAPLADVVEETPLAGEVNLTEKPPLAEAAAPIEDAVADAPVEEKTELAQRPQSKPAEEPTVEAVGDSLDVKEGKTDDQRAEENGLGDTDTVNEEVVTEFVNETIESETENVPASGTIFNDSTMTEVMTEIEVLGYEPPVSDMTNLDQKAVLEELEKPTNSDENMNIVVDENTIITTAAVHEKSHLEDFSDEEIQALSDVRLPAVTPEPVSKAANHRAFQNLVDENYSLKTELKRKDEKLKSNKGKIKDLQNELNALRSKDADANLYSKKLEMALSENLKLKSTQGATKSDKQNNDAYNETEAAFLMRKYQEGKVVEEALRNQITLSANVKDQDDRTIETLTRRVQQLDKELQAKDDRVGRIELELSEVSQIVSGFEEFVDAQVYRQVVEKAKGKTLLSGEKRIKSGRKDVVEGKAEIQSPAKNKSKLCVIQ